MSSPRGKPQRFPVRKSSEQWEVLIVPENSWLPCENEQDARAIAAAPVLEYEALERQRSGPAFANELETTATAFEKYRMGFGARFLRRRAEEARNSS